MERKLPNQFPPSLQQKYKLSQQLRVYMHEKDFFSMLISKPILAKTFKKRILFSIKKGSYDVDHINVKNNL